MDERLICPRFPRASRYHPDWVLSAVSGAANPLWLTEWLCEAMDLRPGMRVLDLGCGRALSSIFLRREFGVHVWATDLWFDANENAERICDANVEDGVFPSRADARSLPFKDEYFDAVVSVDSFMYFGTDDLYLNYLARFVKPGGLIGIAQAGFVEEINEPIPAHLEEWWAADCPISLHSPAWWQAHWERTRIVDVSVADTLPDGWRLWRDWLMLISPDNKKEIMTIESDGGRFIGYLRVVARRRSDLRLFDPLMRFPADYTRHPLLRIETS